MLITYSVVFFIVYILYNFIQVIKVNENHLLY